MPRTDVPIIDITRAGVSAAAGGSEVAGDTVNDHAMKNTGKEFLHCRNTNAGAQTITLEIAKLVDGQAVTDPVVSIPGTETKLIGPFPESIYDVAQGSTDAGSLLFQASHADIKLQAFRMP